MSCGDQGQTKFYTCHPIVNDQVPYFKKCCKINGDASFSKLTPGIDAMLLFHKTTCNCCHHYESVQLVIPTIFLFLWRMQSCPRFSYASHSTIVYSVPFLHEVCTKLFLSGSLEQKKRVCIFLFPSPPPHPSHLARDILRECSVCLFILAGQRGVDASLRHWRADKAHWFIPSPVHLSIHPFVYPYVH